MRDFEASFSEFIDSIEYDRAEGAIFSLVRIAFKAGWLSAGGEPWKPSNITPIFGEKYAEPHTNHNAAEDDRI